jgi:hypothetical protein
MINKGVVNFIILSLYPIYIFASRTPLINVGKNKGANRGDRPNSLMELLTLKKYIIPFNMDNKKKNISDLFTETVCILFITNGEHI